MINPVESPQSRLESELKEHVISQMQSSYPDKIKAIYGIGSFFFSDLPIKTPIDIIVILTNTDTVPRKDWTTTLFEEETWNGFQIRYMYASTQDYLDRERFQVISFSNYAWSIRALKHLSKIIYGDDIITGLPEVVYTEEDYEKICLNGLYHLENAIMRNMTNNERLFKGMIKIAFLILVIQEPDADYHSVEAILKQIEGYAYQNIASADFYQNLLKAYRIRKGEMRIDPREFIIFRKQCVISVFDELYNHVNGMDWKSLRILLQTGFGNRGFISLRLIGDEYEQYGS